MEGQKTLRLNLKYLKLCSKDERRVNVVFAAQVSGFYINMVSLYTLWHIQTVAIVIKEQCKVIMQESKWPQDNHRYMILTMRQGSSCKLCCKEMTRNTECLL